MGDRQKLHGSVLEEYGISVRYGLSVFCRPSLTAEEIAQFVGTTWLPQAKMRPTTVAALRAIGLDVVRDDAEVPAHALVLFNAEPTDADWDAVEQAFEEPRPNPVRR
jgi:hypothetical protein